MKFIKSLFASLIVSATILGTSYSANPLISYVELTDNSTHAGNRKSRSTLKCVERKDASGNKQDISLNAVANISDGDGTAPNWTASEGSISSSGSNATWTGQENSNISASLLGSSTSATVDFSNPTLPKVEFEYETSGLKPVIEKVTDWLERNYKKPTFQVGGKFSFVPSRCDYYNDGSKLGTKVDASADLKVELPSFNPETPPIPTIVPGVTIKGKLSIDTLKIEAGLGGSYNQELADPWATPIKGTISGTTGVAITLEGQGGPDAVSVKVSATISSKITASGEVKRNQNDIRLEAAKLSIGDLKGTVNVSANVKIGPVDWKIEYDAFERIFSKASDFEIDAPKVLYTVPS